jgi:HAE1 family hydrophobic/amphiphilic exporter-1
MDIPAVSVFTTYEGASAADIETNITKILEDRLNTVNNLKKLTSKSYDNFSLVNVEFEWGINLDEATNDVRDAISVVEGYLPEDSDKPVIFKFNSSMIPVVVLSATAEESYAAINKILEDKLTNPLNRIDGVGAVSISGAPIREVQVNLDPVKMEAYSLTIEQIGQVIGAENLNVPGGTFDVGSESYTLRIEGEFANSDEMRDVVISRPGMPTVLLSDVATIKDTLKKETINERIDGGQGVRIIVQKQSGANSVSVASSVLAEIERLKPSLPPDIKLGIIVDTSEFIQDSISSLSETVMYAFLFVVLVVLFFLGRWRATFIIALTIPVSLITAFIYMYATGGSINVITLSSLSIAIGMVVDDAIVVLENITKHIERGSSAREASIYGTNEVWLAVIATTLTVVAVFLPLTMVGGMAGIMFRPFGWIVSIVVTISTVAAITLTPTLSALMLKGDKGEHTYKGLGILFKPIDIFLDKLDSGYAKLLTWSIRHRTGMIIGCALVFIASLFLINQVPTEFIPESDNAQMSATVELPQGTGLESTRIIARKIDSIIKKDYPEVLVLSTSAGAADGSNIFAAFGKSGTHIINYMMRFTKSTQRDRDIFEIGDLLRHELSEIPEVEKYTVTPGGSSGGSFGGNTVDVQIFGYDFDVTSAYANRLADSISKNVTGARDTRLSRDPMQLQYRVEFDRRKLAHYGLNMGTAANYVRNRINGLTASLYREDGDEYDIVVRYDEKFRESVQDIENILIYNNQGQAVRVQDVGRVVEYFTPPTIERENRQRIITVHSNLYGAALGDVVAGMRQEIAKLDTPAGVYVDIGGTYEDQQESFADMGTLLLLIVVLVYIVMATQFESLRMPFIIMLSLPFAFTGVFFALWMTNTPLSLIALIGAVMLVGIVVKTGIVMVDFTNLLRERGMAVSQAVIAAGKSRLRPVLMTALTTILGMLPLAIGSGEGSAIWKPMGIAVIGGLTFSTILTLVVIPIVYTLFGASYMKKERKRIAKLQAEFNELGENS